MYMFIIPMMLSDKPPIVAIWEDMKAFAWDYPFTVIALHVIAGILYWYLFLKERECDNR